MVNLHIFYLGPTKSMFFVNFFQIIQRKVYHKMMKTKNLQAKKYLSWFKISLSNLFFDDLIIHNHIFYQQIEKARFKYFFQFRLMKFFDLNDPSEVLDVGQLLVDLPQLVVERDEPLAMTVKGIPWQSPVEDPEHLADDLHDPARVVGPRNHRRQSALAGRRHRVSLGRSERV